MIKKLLKVWHTFWADYHYNELIHESNTLLRRPILEDHTERLEYHEQFLDNNIRSRSAKSVKDYRRRRK
jgi:hypothetical protein